jgi:dipeptidase D
MTTFVSDFEPQALWRHFDQILTIPRASKDEGQMRDYVVGIAEAAGLAHRSDAAGNVVVSVPGTAGHENAPSTILQGHMDMVQEKNSDVDFDFSTDAIVPRRDGEYLNATGTTLGSDNGIGLAAMLALMDGAVAEHGPLELLFTIDEETGLTGAAQLDASILNGRRLINMDSEDEGVLCVGCAGGADTTVSLALTSAPVPEGTAALDLKLSGLKGGHSGIDIFLQRGNAIQLMARAIHAVSRDYDLRLAALAGGTAHNAIPREAFATVLVAATDSDAVAAALEAQVAAIARELKTVEPDAALSVDPADAPEECWDEASSRAVIRLLTSLPHGIETMSYDIPGLVETSTNLATAHVTDGALAICMSTRSSVASALEALRGKIRAIAELAGAAADEHEGYPGWEPDMESDLLQVVRALHERELGVDPKVEAVHAGLECGLIGEMIPGMDMISFGPQIEFPHSPDERVKIDSVGRFWKLLTVTLAELAS